MLQSEISQADRCDRIKPAWLRFPNLLYRRVPDPQPVWLPEVLTGLETRNTTDLDACATVRVQNIRVNQADRKLSRYCTIHCRTPSLIVNNIGVTCTCASPSNPFRVRAEKHNQEPNLGAMFDTIGRSIHDAMPVMAYLTMLPNTH